jgi:hypothetical protein
LLIFVDDTFPFRSAAFAASLSGFQILRAKKEQGYQADKQSNLGRFSWKTQIYDLWKAAMKISPNSRAVL